MKSFDNVLNKEKKVAINEQQKVFAADKARLVAAIKHEYGVKDFNSVNEAEKESYKAMISEMWNASTGLNEKGIAFINESAAVLTEKSTDEQIEKYFKKEIKACLVDLKKKVEEDSKRKLSNKVAKQWIYDVCCNYIGSKIKSVKF